MTKINYNYNGPLRVGIGGPVGSGKTTLLNVIAALDIPTAGEYDFDNEAVPLGRVEEMTTFRRSNVGYIFQFWDKSSSSYLPDFSIL